MCCQPPNNNDDLERNYIKNIALVNSAPLSLPSLGITGGEPTLLGDKLFTLINHIKGKLHDTEIHLLTNGRAFADLNYTKKLMQCGTEKILLGIPIHSDCSIDHDYITQTIGSFDETMLGLYNLERCGFDIELRIVLNKITCQRLSQIANFIYRNLPFVRYVAFMGIEYTGYTIKNHKLVWIDPLEYQSELENAVCELSRWGIDVSVFNLPHCVLSKALWKFSVKSISDWKNEYAEFCDECLMKDNCCGLFATSRRQSEGLKPITEMQCD
jgi:His-Xaa-Ser system radical SAM maturase HxsC